VTAALSTDPSIGNVGPLVDGGVGGILRAAALMFFAFAGYARIATLGEEVRNPARTIPRAIRVALGITLVVYATVAIATLTAVGPDVLAGATAPLVAVADAGTFPAAVPIVRIGAVVASLGVLLSLLVGVSRTVFAMADERDLPHWLGAVHPTRRVPHRAEVAVAGTVITVILVADVRGAIGFSSFAVLFYYGVANASALTLPARSRRARIVPVLGLVGCVTLACSLPAASIVGGTCLLVVGVGIWLIGRRRTSRARTPT
jgi:APA family basic amino acid/polyamine antiporter